MFFWKERMPNPDFTTKQNSVSLFFTKFVKLDPDPHSFYLLDPDPHSEKLLDPDPPKMNADPHPWCKIYLFFLTKLFSCTKSIGREDNFKSMRAVDPHSFCADTDPAVFLNADPDPEGKMNADPDPAEQIL